MASATRRHNAGNLLARMRKRVGSGSLRPNSTEREPLSNLADRRGFVSAVKELPCGLGLYRIEADSIELLDFNNAYARLFGMAADEYGRRCRRDPMTHVLSDDRWIVEAASDQLLAGSSRAEGSIRTTGEDGAQRWLSLSASLAHLEPDVAYAVVTAVDTTEDKEKDLRYRQQAEQQQQLYEAVPCGIVRHTLEESPRVESANRAACRILGFDTYADLLNTLSADVFGVMVGSGRMAVKDAVASLRAGAQAVPFDTQIKRADGTVGWIEGVISLTTTSDGTAVVQSAFNDVTRERQESHKRELQRFTSVLCSVYDEIFEFNLEHDTFTLWFTSQEAIGDIEEVPLDAAINRWFRNLPREEDRAAILAALESYRNGIAESTTTVTCLCVTEERTVWFETTFLRMSDATVLCCNSDVTQRKLAEDEHLSQQVNDVVANLPVGIGVYDVDKTGAYPLYVSDAVCAMTGSTRQDFDRLIAARRPSASGRETRAFLAEHEHQDWFDFSTEREVLRRGARFTARVQGRATRIDDDTVRVHVVITDVADEVRERNERAWQNERYRILNELTHAISFDYDSRRDEVLLHIDRDGEGVEAQLITNYLETLDEERVGIVHPGSIETVRSMFERVCEGASNEVVEYRADYYGTGYQWYRANLFIAQDGNDAWHLVGLIDDIQTERELRQRAEYDAVTGLSNYASTRDLVNDALADPHVRAHSVCAVIDLDDFKAVNDNCGHLRGDWLLRQVGDALRGNCRESDIAGRVGGDEFVVFLKGINLETALRKLAAMRSAVSKLTLQPKHASESSEPLVPSVSIGATATRAEDADYSDAFARADEALYRAKRSGKNRLRVG